MSRYKDEDFIDLQFIQICNNFNKKNKKQDQNVIENQEKKDQDSGQFQLEKEQEQKLELAQNEKENFIDEDFPPNENSLGKKVLKRKKLKRTVWKRALEFIKYEDLQVFQKNKEQKIIQGRIGDCYLINPVTILSLNGINYVERLFYIKQKNECGYYSVWLNIDGIWKYVVVDDFFPWRPEDNLPQFCYYSNQQIWPMVIEKAWAKLNGGYQYLWGGHSGQAFRVLTGAPVQFFSISKFLKDPRTKQKLYKKIKESLDKQYLVSFSTRRLNEHYQKLWTQGHSYALSSIDLEKNEISIRDPRREFCAFKREFVNISFDEVIYIFSGMFICKVVEKNVFSSFQVFGSGGSACMRKLIRIKFQNEKKEEKEKEINKENKEEQEQNKGIQDFWVSLFQASKRFYRKDQQYKNYKLSQVNFKVYQIIWKEKQEDEIEVIKMENQVNENEKGNFVKGIEKIELISEKKGKFLSKDIGINKQEFKGEIFLDIQADWETQYHKFLNIQVYYKNFIEFEEVDQSKINIDFQQLNLMCQRQKVENQKQQQKLQQEQKRKQKFAYQQLKIAQKLEQKQQKVGRQNFMSRNLSQTQKLAQQNENINQITSNKENQSENKIQNFLKQEQKQENQDQFLNKEKQLNFKMENSFSNDSLQTDSESQEEDFEKEEEMGQNLMRKKLFLVTFLVFIIFLSLGGEVECKHQKKNQQKKTKEQNHYQTLGVKQSASEQEIRKAYKKLAIKYHPDRINDQEEKEKASEKFAEINNAYEVLTDPKLREDYDFQLKYGFSKEQQQQQQQQQQWGHQQRGGNSFFDFFGGGGGGFGGFDFGNFGNFGNQQQQRNQQQYRNQQQQKRENYNQQYQKQQMKNAFKGSEVKNIDLEGLSQFFRREEVWLILFYEPGSVDQRVIESWREMAEKKRDIYVFAAVNCAEEEDICEDEFQVKLSQKEKMKVLGFPVRGGLKSSQSFSDFSRFEAKQIHRFAMQLLSNEKIYLLDSKNYLQVVGDVSKKMVILFTDKDKIPPVFSCIANQLESKFEFGVVYANQKELIKNFGVKEYPSLMILEDGFNYSGEFYKNEFKKENIAQFLKTLKSGQNQKNNKFIELTQEMINQSALCGKNDSKLCLILNLGNNFSILDQYDKIPGQYSNDPIRFLYIKQGFNNELQGEPGFVLVKGKRQKFTSAKIAEKSLNDFLDSALDGSSNFQSFNQSLFDNVFM
ncbi:Thioredoxin-like fold [Pseudocohnilembus persalinus]|uniref:Thioredoxin-like fold n=1 Tax=Pseudocohnilembus persalinus TaxID=266149 RepID=A0A0V0QIM0_PSEPJ|nr:Thioredoxin-like fold [Pseudocohnilembus persalinus]|eukprot:KRX02093.1 Thioredoxin-like fold [Pseudocohnilembus persalinus]